MDFRARLIATLHAVRPVLEQPGVLVLGSEVPNLLESGAASTLVVSQDVDLGIFVASHADVKRRLPEVRGLSPSADEPSVWIPDSEDLIEVNFIGIDPDLADLSAAYVFADSELPLMVFGALSLMRPGPMIDVDGLRVPVPRTAGLMLEKLLTDRSGGKGDRDLLVVAGLLSLATVADLDELGLAYISLSPELRYAVRSNLTLLSLLPPHASMPDPRPLRGRIAELLRRLELSEESAR